ncbi:MAG: OmpA family protein [Candidatus Stygibacter frigidus]|nr:OmpA family protein [Candidatus Stygibacter frigidus]
MYAELEDNEPVVEKTPPKAVIIEPVKEVDSDGDGLTDKIELEQYKTNPNNSDSDSDGLKDGEEVLKYMTDPNNPDTDNDGLKDGEEVLKYKTSPLKSDTDGDGLSDNQEIMKYLSDPLLIDTDNGGMNDGAEVKTKRNPLDPADDLFDFSKGKKVVLHGIVFETNKSTIMPESKIILEKVRESMVVNPDVTVIITGHTDNTGSDEYNRGLSQERAQAVKDWLVKNRISASRMKVIGKGETEPAATNDTKEGRAENRRIEFTIE